MSWIKDIISPETRNWKSFTAIAFSTIVSSEAPMASIARRLFLQIHVKTASSSGKLSNSITRYSKIHCRRMSRGVSAWHILFLVLVQPAAHQVPVDPERTG